MSGSNFQPLMSLLAEVSAVQKVGRIADAENGRLLVSGLSGYARVGDRARIDCGTGALRSGEVLRLAKDVITVVLTGSAQGVCLGNKVYLLENNGFYPDISWLGRVVDPDGQPLDGKVLVKGEKDYPLLASPPKATDRRGLGARMETGLKVLNTLLPIARGQRVGLFSGSGVGKSTLLGQIARNLDADVVVVALVGERGREVSEFVSKTLGPKGMARSVIVAATSDQSPLVKRRAAWAAMSAAEYFRDQGKQVLLVCDSITRFAEAHREIAVATGEFASMRGFPPSTGNQIMALCERAGPGFGDAGDITAVFSVLVAGSDMDEPIADITRGVLDGHIVLDRKIAERGRFPAIDVLRSVSRCLPDVASRRENDLINAARKSLGAYEASEMMIKAGLYAQGADAFLDKAIRHWPLLDAFAAESEKEGTNQSFAALASCFSEAEMATDAA
jgi:flagellum-specific ATP synthase